MPVRSIPHVELVEAAQAGDKPAFGKLVQRYQPLVSSLAHELTGSPSDGQEIAQSAFVLAWRDLPKLRRPESFRTWLCSLTRNVYRHFRRAQKRRPRGDDSAYNLANEIATEDPSPLDRAISAEEERLLARALGSVPEPYRAPLLLFYREEKSVDKVAAALNLSVAAAAKRLFRARQKLNDSLKHRASSSARA